MSCADVHMLAAEAALGLLSGDDRAAVLDHIDRCDECRVLVGELSASTDELLLLAPVSEPPLGFEQRVLDKLAAEPVRRRRRRWIMPAVAAAVAAIVALGTLWLAPWRETDPSVAELTMRTPVGEVVGDAYLHRSDPAWVFVAVPRWSEPSSDYELRVTLADGSVRHIAGPRGASARAGWGATIDASSDEIVELALVGADGHVWCSATR